MLWTRALFAGTLFPAPGLLVTWLMESLGTRGVWLRCDPGRVRKVNLSLHGLCSLGLIWEPRPKWSRDP